MRRLPAESIVVYEQRVLGEGTMISRDVPDPVGRARFGPGLPGEVNPERTLFAWVRMVLCVPDFAVGGAAFSGLSYQQVYQ